MPQNTETKIKLTFETAKNLQKAASLLKCRASIQIFEYNLKSKTKLLLIFDIIKRIDQCNF